MLPIPPVLAASRLLVSTIGTMFYVRTVVVLAGSLIAVGLQYVVYPVRWRRVWPPHASSSIAQILVVLLLLQRSLQQLLNVGRLFTVDKAKSPF